MLKLLMLTMCMANAVFSTSVAVKNNASVVVEETMSAADTETAKTKSVIDQYSDDIYIKFFETYVVKSKVVSQIPTKRLAEMATRYEIDVNRLKVLLCLQYALQETGANYTVSELNKMTDGEIIGHALTYYATFWKNLSADEKEEVKTQFNKAEKAVKEKTATTKNEP